MSMTSSNWTSFLEEVEPNKLVKKFLPENLVYLVIVVILGLSLIIWDLLEKSIMVCFSFLIF